MEDFMQKIWYKEEHTALRDYVWKKSTVIQCYVTPAILADDEDKKIYVKAVEKNYKTSTMTQTWSLKECKFFLILIKHPALTLQNQYTEKINRDKDLDKAKIKKSKLY
jgi:hypothetical protein